MSELATFTEFIDGANAAIAAMRAHPTDRFTAAMRLAVKNAGPESECGPEVKLLLYVRALARGGHYRHALVAFNLYKTYRHLTDSISYWDLSVHTELTTKAGSPDSLFVDVMGTLTERLGTTNRTIQEMVRVKLCREFMREPATTLVQAMIQYGKDNNMTLTRMLEVRGDPDDPVDASLIAQEAFDLIQYKTRCAAVVQTQRGLHSAVNTWRVLISF